MEEKRKDQNDWMEGLTCNLGLRQHLDAIIAEDNKDYVSSSKIPSWYPADLGGDMFLRYVKRKKYDSIPLNPRTLRKFEIGKIWEKRIHEAVCKSIEKNLTGKDFKIIDLHPEVAPPFEKRVEWREINLNGFYDKLLLVNIPKIGWIALVIEVKSVNSMMFHKQKREGHQPIRNIKQLMFYLGRMKTHKPYWDKLCENAKRMFGIEKLVDIWGVLSQVSKDDGSMWERTYKYDKVLYNEIVEEIRELNYYWDNNIIPPKTSDVIIIEDGKAKLNWDISYSNYIHHYLGENYDRVLEEAQRLVNRHAYFKKNSLLKVGGVEVEIKQLNEQYKTK